jgi:arylsulfatase A
VHRCFKFVAVVVLALCVFSAPARAVDKPNIVVIFCDDLGYGDLGCFGHPTIKTPNLDRMANEGIKLTQFYSASPVCTPSRAALMTGRLPIRSGMCSDKRRVLFPNSKGGLPASEVTVAEGLSAAGYKTACFGKWHLGHLPQFLPTNNGFDTYFGIPYSNDMDRLQSAPKGRASFLDPKSEYWNVPLMKDLKIAERPADQTTITKRYTQATIDFIAKNKDDRFFVYLPHSLPHVPLFRAAEFEGVSRRGLYGDVIQEIDWSVGQVLNTLRDLKLEKNTIVWFTSDNGPWLSFDDHGGSAGLLRSGKGTTWEGGMREPTIAWWPGTIPAGQVSGELGTTMDIYTTNLTLGGAKIPTDRVVDGKDISKMLMGKGKSPRNAVYYYRGTRLMAMRLGQWKAHFISQESYTRNRVATVHEIPELYNLEVDPSEKYNVAAKNPEIIESIIKAAEAHKKTVNAPPSQLEL